MQKSNLDVRRLHQHCLKKQKHWWTVGTVALVSSCFVRLAGIFFSGPLVGRPILYPHVPWQLDVPARRSVSTHGFSEVRAYQRRPQWSQGQGLPPTRKRLGRKQRNRLNLSHPLTMFLQPLSHRTTTPGPATVQQHLQALQQPFAHAAHSA